MSISDIASSLSKVQTFDPWSMHAVNDARIVLINIHNDNIKLDARIAELTAEVDRLRAALGDISSYEASEFFPCNDIDRNALREGK